MLHGHVTSMARLSLLEKYSVEQGDWTQLITSLISLSLGQLLGLQSPRGSYHPVPFSFPFASYGEKNGFAFLGVIIEQ